MKGLYECNELAVVKEDFVNISETEYRSFNEKDWALSFAESCSSSPVSEERDLALENIKAVLKGAEVKILKKTWNDGAVSFEFIIVPNV